ncbi:hypothetical protein, partial [Prauserella isguenensis]|uniref:hypothetical protein n=1 Tax=Prauserella isguenensis TaxID=1470180 RepID=UPI001C8563C2
IKLSNNALKNSNQAKNTQPQPTTVSHGHALAQKPQKKGAQSNKTKLTNTLLSSQTTRSWFYVRAASSPT